MLATRAKILAVTLVLANASVSQTAHADDGIAEGLADILNEARWAKAERDKSNVWLAEGFMRPGGRATAEPDADMRTPSRTRGAPAGTDR
jgi:hypothetical protein